MIFLRCNDANGLNLHQMERGICMNEQLKVDILELANALMALPKKEQEAIINRAYGMCMYALATHTDNNDDKKTA